MVELGIRKSGCRVHVLNSFSLWPHNEKKEKRFCRGELEMGLLYRFALDACAMELSVQRVYVAEGNLKELKVLWGKTLNQ